MFNRVKPYQLDSSVYVLQITPEEKKRADKITWLTVLGTALLHIVGGMINQPSSRTAWIVFPYLIIYLPLLYAVAGSLIFSKASCRMSSVQYNEGLQRVHRMLVAVFVLTIFGLGLDVVYILLNREQIRLLPELLFLVLHLPRLLVIWAYGRYYDRNLARITIE